MDYKKATIRIANEMEINIVFNKGYLSCIYQNCVILTCGISKGYKSLYYLLSCYKNKGKDDERILDKIKEKIDTPYLRIHGNERIQGIIDKAIILNLQVKKNSVYIEFYENNKLLNRVKGIKKSQQFLSEYQRKRV